jgi:putative ABC transport system substrate-binding protein
MSPFDPLADIHWAHPSYARTHAWHPSDVLVSIGIDDRYELWNGIMRRREFIAALGGASLLPLAALAQRPSMPVIGYLSLTSPEERPTLLAAFLKGLESAGYVVGRNVAIEYRSAAGNYETLPALAAGLVNMRVAVIAASGGEAPARAAEEATTQIPIVFTVGSDPVQAGLVAAMNRPGRNATGVSLLAYEIDGKRLQLLRELVPQGLTIGVLAFTGSPSLARTASDMQAAAATNGQRLVMLDANSGTDLENVFASLKPQGINALLVTTSPYFEGRRNELVALAQRHSIPVLYPWRDYAAVGGLISYGTSFTESYYQAGLYVGRVLKGEKPFDLPVVQATKSELIVNLRTAKALGLDVPTSILLRADEVIE